METNYKYFRNCRGNICRVHVEREDDPYINPREDYDGNIGHIMAWWDRCKYGDSKENTYSSPEDFVNDLVRTYVPEKSVINYIKAKKTSNGLELIYNRKEEIWELWGYYRYWWTGGEVHHGVIESNNPIDYLIDDMIEAMSFEDKWKLLERNGVVALPVYMYEHSGITMNTGGFSCPWDSGQAGWIYTTKKEILDTCGSYKNDKGNYIKVTDKNWKKAAYQWMIDEVKTYDMYLQGEIYGYILDELDMDCQSSVDSEMHVLEEDDMEWDEDVDSCWGFFSDKWGDELIEEIVKDGIGDYPLYDSVTELVAMPLSA